MQNISKLCNSVQEHSKLIELHASSQELRKNQRNLTFKNLA